MQKHTLAAQAKTTAMPTNDLTISNYVMGFMFSCLIFGFLTLSIASA